MTFQSQITVVDNEYLQAFPLKTITLDVGITLTLVMMKILRKIPSKIPSTISCKIIDSPIMFVFEEKLCLSFQSISQVKQVKVNKSKTKNEKLGKKNIDNNQGINDKYIK